jgi:hypothetical protein
MSRAGPITKMVHRHRATIHRAAGDQVAITLKAASGTRRNL